ncbi:hypothetical protein Atep_12070 [Allochromatium tepidum]|uniref:Uncharacterized protein n=1 Tax=Allochromatium tepidum TaxID=553982 RepID=A0ABM7QLB0_9GAMM|nr:hypothetical protein Atep_12070 [Allochromatium tepidum]
MGSMMAQSQTVPNLETCGDPGDASLMADLTWMTGFALDRRDVFSLESESGSRYLVGIEVKPVNYPALKGGACESKLG